MSSSIIPYELLTVCVSVIKRVGYSFGYGMTFALIYDISSLCGK